MNHTTPDPARDLSAGAKPPTPAPRLPSLAIRKQLALAQAAMDRMEIAQARHELHESVRGWNWLSWLMPRGARGTAGVVAPLFGRVMRHRRLLGAGLSFLLGRRRARAVEKRRAAAAPHHTGHRVRRSFTLGSAAVAGLQAWRTWRRIKTAFARTR